MHPDPPVTDLVASAKSGDERAWAELVERYASLVWSICRIYQLARADAEDVSQGVWLQLAGHLDKLREPAALAGWLATTTHRECLRALRQARKPPTPALALDAEDIPDHQAPAAEDRLLRAERHAALREAFTCLPPGCQQLIAMLIQDPPMPYARISAELGIPVGSIGPVRGRCLDQLRRHPAITALMDTQAMTA